MSDRNLTLFALHLHSDGDVQFGPKSLDRGREEAEQAEEALPDLGTGDSGLSPTVLAGALGVAALAAAAAWRAVQSQ
jgi:hypothetical protein